MSKIDEIIRKLNIRVFSEEEKKLLDKGKNNTYIEKVFGEAIYEDMKIKDEDIGVKMYILNILSPNYVNELLSKNDESLFIAKLILEYLKGITPKDILNTDNKELTYTTPSDDFHNRICANHIYEKLKKYLKSKNMDEDSLCEMVRKHVIDFAKELPNLQKAFFFDYITGKNAIDKSQIINSIFNTEGMDIETLQNIFDQILTTNNTLISFDYEKIFFNSLNIDYSTKIKGLYRKAPKKLFDKIVNINIEDAEKLDEYIKQIIKLNIDDELGLSIFINDLYNYTFIHNKKLNKHIKSQDYYTKYSNKIDYQHLTDKILHGECDFIDDLLPRLGESNEFLTRYDDILDLFMKSNDPDFQRKITIPLVTGLLHNLKIKYKLDFDIVFTAKELNDKLGGYYSPTTNTIYINPYIIKAYRDPEYGLAKSINTIFHEVRHAIQYKKIIRSNSFSFDNLIMAIDTFLQKNTSKYYDENYRNISIERDARYDAYVETSVFLQKYPEVLQKFQEANKEDFDNSIYSHFRKDYIEKEYYHGIIDYFVNYINQPESTIIRQLLIKELKSYPVITKFFDIDYKNLTITIKSEKYFENMKKLFSLLPDKLGKKEGLYSIKAFQYALKVSKYLKEIQVERDDENIQKEVLENVGRSPTR